MESALEYHTARALLEWQVDLGATEAILDAPVNRYDVPEKRKAPEQPAADAPIRKVEIDPVEVAQQMAKSASSLDELQAALAQYPHCSIKNGARSLVFSDGHAAARVMIIGEAPEREEDRIGKPFVGRVGQLLDRMLAAIDMDRTAQTEEQAVYLANVMPWRPPQSRDPLPDEIAMMMPFVQRHVELVDPDFLILMGNIPCQGVLKQRGITRLRGTWVEAFGKPCLPMFHPSHLLRNPNAKREAWADLLSLKARINSAVSS